jgi:hypothetical protein
MVEARYLRRKQPVTMFREAWLWSEEEEKLYANLCIGRTLHLFSGKSGLGDVRVDISSAQATHRIDLSQGHLPFQDLEFDTTIADPPWIGPQIWDGWEKLLREMVRVTRKRIILILTNLIWMLPPPFALKHIYVVKKISPQVKLVYVWERDAESMDEWVKTE